MSRISGFYGTMVEIVGVSLILKNQCFCRNPSLNNC
jgi:hypothetical protein